MELYPYQREAIQALWACWKESPRSAPLIVAPTGSGKSLILSSIIQQITAKHPKFRFIVATHTKEIVGQGVKELQGLMPEEPIGIYSAGLGEKRIRRITFANVQSLYKKAKELECDLLIIDEAHLLSRNQNSMYQKLIAGLQAKNWRVRIVGLTATPMRMDQGSLIAEGSIFTDIAYDISIRKLIDEGYLCPVTSMAKAPVDLSGVSVSGHDYNQKELELAFDRESLIDEHCKDIIKQAGDRKSWLIFCAGVQHAKDVSTKFRMLGITSDYVSGEMCNWERDIKIQEFKDGKTKALCNVSVLTTGFNFRGIDVVALLRATKSASLYIQSVGRGTRTAPLTKKDCLVLDYGGNILRHGPIDLVQVKTKKGVKAEIGVAPHKSCPICGCVVAIGVSFCPSCEYAYPDSTKTLELKATSAPILSQVETHEVLSTVAKRHKKMGKPDSFKIEYQCKGIFMPFADYFCFDHGGFATSAAQRKWLARGGRPYSPRTVQEAFMRQGELLAMPVIEINVIKKTDSKFYEILSIKRGTPETAEERERSAEAAFDAANPF